MPEARFVLYYWPLPFRAQAARYILAAAGIPWDEPGRDAVMAIYQARIGEQPVPFMGPPVLHDREADLWLSQLPAIAGYLGAEHGLMPGNPAQDALTYKVVNDCVDVLQELTRNCGMQMWTRDTWDSFADQRLPRWLALFEELGRRNGLELASGTLLGTPQPGVADLACAALWISIDDTLPKLGEYIGEYAPSVFALAQRVAATPAIRDLRADQRDRWGDVWCEGQIEASLRSVLATWQR